MKRICEQIHEYPQFLFAISSLLFTLLFLPISFLQSLLYHHSYHVSPVLLVSKSSFISYLLCRCRSFSCYHFWHVFPIIIPSRFFLLSFLQSLSYHSTFSIPEIILPCLFIIFPWRFFLRSFLPSTSIYNSSKKLLGIFPEMPFLPYHHSFIILCFLSWNNSLQNTV